tara:strand:- start:374 stop:559 length:186 start_codon:yes stop_codon:yes gene_type:complete
MKIKPHHVELYFELDLDNCDLTRKDFCKIISEFIQKPKKTSKYYKQEIKTYFEEREYKIED